MKKGLRIAIVVALGGVGVMVFGSEVKADPITGTYCNDRFGCPGGDKKCIQVQDGGLTITCFQDP